MKKILFYLLALGIVSIAACKDPVGGEPTPDLPKISIGSVTLFEGEENKIFTFQVVMSAVSTETVSVNYATEEVTAGETIDFIATSGTLTIAAGEQTGTIEVEVVGDIYKEQDETFKLILSNAVNATIINAEGIGTIRNEDTFVDIPEDGYITPESYTGFNLVWQDEFADDALDLSNWTHEIGGSGWGNNELQYYTDSDENSYLSDGNLVIEAKEQNAGGNSYTSARLITQNKQTFKHGRIDIRAILPEGQGIWPALWMLGNNISDIGWPACGEIDIMELVGHEPTITHGTAHWGPQGQTYSTYDGDPYDPMTGEKFSEKYHVFSLIWEENSIKWLVDDNQFFSITDADVNVTYPFNKQFFFIFNIAVGGNWPGNPDATTQFPQRMFVDYVRVFQEN